MEKKEENNTLNIHEIKPVGLEQGKENSCETDKNALEFKKERYKFILSEIQNLNGNIHKYLTLYQTLVTAVIGAGIYVFINYKKMEISPDVAQLAIKGLLGLLVLLSVFVIISMLSGLFSWFDYRKEEVALLDVVVAKGFRKLPEKGNFWRWYETYIILFILFILIAVVVFTNYSIIPLMK